MINKGGVIWVAVSMNKRWHGRIRNQLVILLIIIMIIIISGHELMISRQLKLHT